MKHNIIFRVGWGLSFLLLSLITPLTLAQSRITICHVTGNGNHNILEVSSNGWNGHSNHEHDFIIQSDEDRARCSNAPVVTEPPTPEPTTETPTPEPTTETPTSEPTTETPTPEPTTETPTPEPTTETPTAEPTTETPTAEPTTETPTSEPTTETPTPEPTTETPTPEPTTETPTPEPTTETPTPEPTTETPTPEPTTETPSPEPTTETPSPEPTTETPTPEPTCDYEVDAGDAVGFLSAVDLANNDGRPSVICLGGGTYAMASVIGISTEIEIQGNSSTITGNTGQSIFNIASASLSMQDVTIQDGVSNFGGAIFVNASSITLMNVAFINNNATSQGGAIYNFNSAITISNGTFLLNQANTGGAIFSIGGSAQVTISGTDFTKNQANVGGVLRNEGAVYIINTSNFIDNRAFAESSAISHATSGNFDIQTSVVTDNIADNGAVITSGNANFTINQSCIFNNTSATDDVLNTSVVGAIDATNDWWGSPAGPNHPDSDTVSEQVNFMPFLTEAPAICAP